MGRILMIALGVCLATASAGATTSWKKHANLGQMGPKRLEAETFAVAKQTYFAIRGEVAGQTNLIRSKDGGVTWEPVPGLSAKERVESVVARDATVYVATSAGIYLSATGGDTWVQIKKGMTKKRVTSLAAGKEQVVAVVDRTSLLCAEKDKKGAWKWKRAKKGLPKTYDNLGDLAISGRAIFVGVMIDDERRTAKVFRSTDNCKTFTPVMVGPTVKASDEMVIAGGIQGFAVSSDQGASFATVPSPTRQEGTYNFVVIGQAVYAGLLDVQGPSAILRLDADKQGWDRLSLAGLPQTKIPPVFMVAGGHVYLIANASELYSIDVTTLAKAN
jgi:hypothetical protein